MVDPSALTLTIAAFFAPLQNQAFISTVEICDYDQVMIRFSDRAPQDLGEKMAPGLSEIPATLINAGATIDLSSFTSRKQIRAVASQATDILIATRSTAARVAERALNGPAKLDQRDREFLDNVPPHHGE